MVRLWREAKIIDLGEILSFGGKKVCTLGYLENRDNIFYVVPRSAT